MERTTKCTNAYANLWLNMNNIEHSIRTEMIAFSGYGYCCLYLCMLRDFLCIFIFNHIIVKTSIDINDISVSRWIYPQHMKTSPLSYSIWRWYPFPDVGITYSPNRNDNIISYTWTNGYFLTVVISHFINWNVRFNQPKSLTV